jgi:hypothetical protein
MFVIMYLPRGVVMIVVMIYMMVYVMMMTAATID